MKLLFLINPHAGKAEIKNKALEIIDLFIQNGYEVTVHTTQAPMEIPQILKRTGKKYDLIVTCGGDGTLNETVEGLLRLKDNAPPLGYIPAGTVNDFASSLGISKNMTEAAKDILNGKLFLCDIGIFEKRFFTYIAAFGAFTDVSYQTPQEFKNLLGRAAYILEGIRRLPSIQSYHIQIEHDGQTDEGDFLFGMVSNSTSVAGIKVADKANILMDDGLLEVMLVRNPGNVAQAQALLSAILRREMDSEFLLSFRTSRLFLSADTDVPWTLDGEFGGAVSKADISVCPKALKILIPRT